jgi:SET domain-containing protein
MKKSRRPSRHCSRTPPSRRTPGNESVSVSESTLGLAPGERGLFVAAAVKAGTVVCSFMPLSLTRRGHEKWLATHELEEYRDAAVHDLGRVLVDPSFVCREVVPLWYFLNHSASPNLRLSRQSDRVCFIATVDIRQFEELTFSYGSPDPAWDQ